MEKAKFIEVEAEVRYWEDALVNGEEDIKGTLIPCRNKNFWCPTIDLFTGQILNWTLGVEAKICYKVCDAGEYWLLDSNKKRIAKWKTYYVPDKFLCVGNNGYGDYIILKINTEGFIIDWEKPSINPDEWINIP